MVLKPEPLIEACEALQGEGAGRAVLMAPQGRRLDQALCRALAAWPAVTLICGRYEGVDERVLLAVRPELVSIGDYVLTGGELAAMVLIDAVVRLLPGVLAEGSAEDDSFAIGLLQGPLYTRPRSYRGMSVPEVLCSGDHRRIAAWRRREALRRTWRSRPDLLADAPLSAEDGRLLASVIAEEASDQASVGTMVARPVPRPARAGGVDGQDEVAGPG